MTPEERQAFLAKFTPEQVAEAQARYDAWNATRRSFGEEKDGHRTCWGCIHAHFGPMPRRVCSVRKDAPFIYGAPYDELKPEYEFGHLPGRTVADECKLYEHGLPKVLDMVGALASDLRVQFEKHTEFRHLAKQTANGKLDGYKPFYRAISLILAPDGLWPGARRQDVEEVLRALDPYFTWALKDDRSTFDHLYDVFIDLYPPEATP